MSFLYQKALPFLLFPKLLGIFSRWLIARDRTEEAKEILYSAAKRNKLDIEKEMIVLKVNTTFSEFLFIILKGLI